MRASPSRTRRRAVPLGAAAPYIPTLGNRKPDLGKDARMREQTKTRLKLAGTAFAQVVFVAMNTVFIAHYELLANFATAFAISLIWTFNVKRVAFGDAADRWAYAGGAAVGSVVGTVVASAFV